MATKRRFSHVTSGMAAGQLSEASQDNLSLDVREQGLAKGRNIRLERDGGIRTRHRFETPGVSFDRRIYSSLQSWTHDATASVVADRQNQAIAGALPHTLVAGQDGVAPINGVFGVVTPQPPTAPFFQVNLLPQRTRALTLHECRLLAGSHLTDAKLTFEVHVYGSPQDEPDALSTASRAWWRLSEDADGNPLTDPFDPRAFAPGLISRDITIHLDNAGVPAWVERVALTLTSGVASGTVRLQVGGVSALISQADREDGPEIENFTRFVRLIPWGPGLSRIVIALTPVESAFVAFSPDGRLHGRELHRDPRGTGNPAIWHFTPKQLDELTWTRFGNSVLLFHTDFPHPLELKLAARGGRVEIDPLDLSNVPDLPADLQEQAVAEINTEGGVLEVHRRGLFLAPSGAALALTETETELRASWEDVGEATGYELAWTSATAYRADPAAFLAARTPTTPFASLPGNKVEATQASHTLTGLTAGTEYAVLVRAVYTGGRSQWTAPLFMAPGTAPAVPTGLAVAYRTPAGARRLTWTAVALATDYELQYRIRTGAWRSLVTTTRNLATLDFNGGARVTYGFRVRAVRVLGASTLRSGWSGEVTSAALQDPAVPAGLSVAYGRTTRAVSWRAAARAASYNVRYRVGAAAWTEVNASAESYTITSAAAADTYEVQVRSVGRYGLVSGWSSSFSSVQPAAPAAPSNLGVDYGATPGPRVLTWHAVAGATSYIVRHRIGSAAWTMGTTTSTRFTLTTTSTAAIEFQVKAVNTYGREGAWSSSITSAAIPAVSQVGTPSATRRGTTQVRFTWSRPANATAMRLEWRRGGTTSSTAVSLGAVSSYDLTRPVGFTYQARVRMVDRFGRLGAWSAWSTAVEIGPPAAPSISVAWGSSGTDPTQRVVSWGAVSGAQRYEVGYRIGSAAWTTSTQSGTGFTLTGATASSAYEFRVRARGASLWSGYDTETSSGQIQPGSVSPTASRRDGLGILVSWGAASRASSYQLEYRSPDGDPTSVTLGNVTSYSHWGSANASLQFRVRAADARGVLGPWSGWTPTITLTPLTLPAPTGVTLTRIGFSSNYRLSWNAVTAPVALSTALNYSLRGTRTGGGTISFGSTTTTSSILSRTTLRNYTRIRVAVGGRGFSTVFSDWVDVNV